MTKASLIILNNKTSLAWRKQCSYCLTHCSFCVAHWWPNFGVKCLSITYTQTCAVEGMLAGWRISSLSPVFPLYNRPSQQSEMLINQLREITGIQDPQILYKALNVRPKNHHSFLGSLQNIKWHHCLHDIWASALSQLHSGNMFSGHSVL